MILVTGDIHGEIDIHKLKSKRIYLGRKLTKNDYLIICGDFGLVWQGSADEKYWLKWLEAKPYTTLFVDGNHENHAKLDSMEVSQWHGGKVHQISDSIYHLMRGQAYEIDGRSVFTMGGADSHDKEYRTEGINWWARELPSEQEYEEAVKTLEEHNYTFDIVVTHCAPSNVQKELMIRKLDPSYTINKLTDFLQEIEGKLDYKYWFCGHYHTDVQTLTAPKLRVLYNNIERV